jgi:outer membrane autotransporter protein
VISGEFYGGAGSELALDVALGGVGSTADTLVVGTATGSTEILVNDTLAGTPGALNFGGILVVDSANGAQSGSAFTMDNIDKGFIEYSLIFDAATDNFLIVGLPDDEVFELLGAMSASQDFWSRSGDAVSARWQELRDANGSGSMSAGPGGMGRSDGWELWMQAHGGYEGWENVESFSLGGFTFASDLTEQTDWRGFQFGFDNLQGDMLWGLTMGFTQQETTFDFDHNSFDIEGWNIGGYAGWASNGFFLNALLKGDFYEVDANFHTLPSIFTFDGITWGAKGELGYRFDGGGWFFEPSASLAWSSTDLDSVTDSGATIDFDNADSLVAKAGARIGGTYGSGDAIWTPFIGAYWVDEMEGDNDMTFTTGVTSISFTDEGRGNYGQAEFGINFQSFYGLEGFVKGEWNFGGDADGGAARLGVRWRW